MTKDAMGSGRIAVCRAGMGMLAASAMAVLSCQSKVVPLAEGNWQFQCPQGAIRIQLVSRVKGQDSVQDSISEIPLSGPVANIPEYHDCQRFIDSSGNYSSIYAIFAAFRLDTVSGQTPTPVATIYTPDGSYPPLGIDPGFNCLLLSEGTAGWEAMMVPRGQGRGAADCGTVSPTGGERLEVKKQPVPDGFEPVDYPPVARWDWDSVHAQQYIGMRCGGAWCEIGAMGFQPSPGYQGPTLAFDPPPGVQLPPNAVRRVQVIKGWYDEQELAHEGAAPQRPSGVHGVLIPSPALDLVNWSQDPLVVYRGHWVHVAYAVLPDGDYTKWNFRRGANKILLCYGTSEPGSCSIPATAQPENPTATPVTNCPPDPTNPALRWWEKTVSATGDTTYSCVRRMDHLQQLLSWKSLNQNMEFRIPGTARWKFMLTDESTWVSCPTGCCTRQ